MKKVFALLLTAALAAAATTTAFADTQYSQTFGPENTTPPSMDVTYTVNSAYTVTIPALVTLSSTTKDSTATVKAENVTVPNGKKVKVSLTGTNQNNEFKVKSAEGAELAYAVSKNGTAIALNGTVLEVASDAEDKKGEAELKFAITDNIVYSGEYTGTVTFKVSVG